MTIYRPGQRLYYPSSPGVRVVQPGGAAIPWYLSGGIAAANCIAAYTPKGSSSLAASYDNNAAPGNGLADGTYDAALGVAPTFDAATGWTFNTLAYLITGYTPTATNHSIIVRFSALVGGGSFPRIIGASNAGNSNPRTLISPSDGGPNSAWANGGGASVFASASLAGVACVSGAAAYFDGVNIGMLATSGGALTFPLWIGGQNSGGLLQFGMIGNVQAVAIYNATLTPAQVAAVSAAMAAL